MSKQLDLFTPSDAHPAQANPAEDRQPREAAVAPEEEMDPNLRVPANDMGAATESAPSAAPATMADLLLCLDQLPFERRKRAEMKSAVRTFCKAVGTAPQFVTTEIATTSKLISGVSPALAGLTLKRWTCVRSLLLSALRQCGIEVMPGRSTEALSSAWAATLGSLEIPGHRHALSPFARYMSTGAVEPSEVTKAHFDAFRDDRVTGSFHQKPDAAYRAMVRIWNKASTTIVDWPQLVVELEPDPRRYSLDWQDFPERFRDDLEAFLSQSGHPDPLSEDYWKPVSPHTVDQRRGQARQLASALIGSGFPIAELTSLAVLVTAANAEAALGYLYDRNGKSSSKHLASQAILLRTIARHWVKTRVDDVRLGQMASNLKVHSSGMVEKNRKRLLQFDLPENVDALLNLPAKVARQADRKPTGSRDEALRVMFAVAVEILTMAPMRLANLAQIEIGPHLVETRRGDARALHIVIPSKDTKTKAPYEMSLPKDCQALIERYIEAYRPRVFSGPSMHLFPGRHGGCRALGPFSTDISEFILKQTGIVMHTHLFRHLAGKLYLDANPNDIETVRRLLSHKSTNTTLRSYTSLTGTHAIERYDRLVTSLRSSMPKGPSAPRDSRTMRTR